MAIDETIESELRLSDSEFRKNYLTRNGTWWQEHLQTPNGIVHCADCNGEIINSNDLRPFGGRNYDAPCFRKHAYEEVISVRGFDTPEHCLATEWLLKTSRVLDGVTLLGEEV